MPVTLRRHLRTIKVSGKRVVPISAKKEGIRAGRELRAELNSELGFGKSISDYYSKGKIKSYSSEVERAVLGAKTAQRAFGLKKGKVNLRKEIGWAGFFIDEKKAMDLLKNKYGGDEIKARNAWLAGDTCEGSLHPAKQFAETIIKRRFGLALAAEAGKAGFGRKAALIKYLVQDNVTHSWIVESVVKRLTLGMKNAPKIAGLPKETTGIKMAFVRQPNGKFRVQMSYEEFIGDVTKNFSECMLPSMKKYLDA
ncbi:MAG: hypothetical protein WC462_04060 [archaeon]